jgi:protein-S-isoprenylcysteine O-methyltransferase Ste14
LTLASRLGGWLFRQRTWLPLPLVAALLVFPPQPDAPGASLWIMGALIVAIGEAIRLWAVHHIGAISRTRSDRLGPLVSSGPFALIRNPLYVGNILLWTGFAVSAQLVWLAPIVVVLLALEYHAIVRWEEGLLARRIGEPYSQYAARVPRWLPSLARLSSSPEQGTPAAAAFSWRQTLFSERGTLIAIGAGFVLLWLKARF